MINFEYTRAGTIKAASEARQKDAASQFIAGGTNLVDLMKKGILAPQRLIDINGLPLKEIKTDAKESVSAPWCPIVWQQKMMRLKNNSRFYPWP